MEIVFRLQGRPNLAIEFVVDTGFDGFLSLPMVAIVLLGLPFDQRVIANLADGRSERVDLFRATIVWEGNDRAVTVLALGQRPLLGTALLDGHDLAIRFVDGGSVAVLPVP